MSPLRRLAVRRAMAIGLRTVVAALLLCATGTFGWIVEPTRDGFNRLTCAGRDPLCAPGRGCVALAALNGSAVCLHKNFWPPSPADGYASVLLFGAGVLAGASGIGGGGLNVPLLMLAQGFLIEEAVPLSHIMVMGNSLAQNAVNLRRRHPSDARRPMVDFDVPLLMLPMQLGGNALGVMLSPVLPGSLLIVLSCAVLVIAAVKTLHRAVHDFGREKIAGSSGRSSATSSAALLLEGRLTPASDSQGGLATTGTLLAANLPTLSSTFPAAWGCRPIDSASTAPSPASPCSWWGGRSHQQRSTTDDASTFALKMVALLLFWALFVADYFGVQATHAHDRCSLPYLGWQLALLIVVGLASAVGAYLARSHDRQLVEGDVQWTSRKLLSAIVLVGAGAGDARRPALKSWRCCPRYAFCNHWSFSPLSPASHRRYRSV